MHLERLIQTGHSRISNVYKIEIPVVEDEDGTGEIFKEIRAGNFQN